MMQQPETLKEAMANKEKQDLEPEGKNFFILHKYMANDHDLSVSERMLLCMITSLDNEDNCYATNQFFADIIGVSIRQIQRMILHLVELEKIEIVGKYRNRRIIKSLCHERKFDGI